MKLFLLSFSLICSGLFADDFLPEATVLTQNLRQSLMENLSEKVKKDGPVNTIDFCHENVSKIAKGAAGDFIKKYQFGRTSHKVRNSKNTPLDWMDSYLKEFQGHFKGELKKEYLVHQFENKKRAFLRPIYIEAQCLTCHGENISIEIKNKISKIYPNDQATGFKLGEFRGFIWVKE